MDSPSQILVINSGSSSIKTTVFEIAQHGLKRLQDGHFKLSGNHSSLTLSGNGKQEIISHADINDFRSALLCTLKSLQSLSFPLLRAVGHRIVHGGPKHTATVQITAATLKELEEISYLAPLHNPACLEGVRCAMEYFPEEPPHIAVFDTAFHSRMPPQASTYAIPSTVASKYAIKRYGFHGISHEFVWNAYEKMQQGGASSHKVITLHLGSGCSATAICAGRSIDTSMGLTPAEGLVMGTRCGDIDPGLIPFLATHAKLPIDEIEKMLNFQSGLLGVSSSSSDMQTLLANAHTSEAASFAVDLFVYRAIKYLGAYTAILEGIDAILFSGGIGENSFLIREKIIAGMGWLGIQLDAGRNQTAIGLQPAQIVPIHTNGSTAGVYVVGTDENQIIAEESLRLTK
jgi:acetate kinase